MTASRTEEQLDALFPRPRTVELELERLRSEKEILTRAVAALNKENARLLGENERLWQRLERAVAANHPGVAK
jgi:regulator of replication initiation timing